MLSAASKIQATSAFIRQQPITLGLSTLHLPGNIQHRMFMLHLGQLKIVPCTYLDQVT